MRWTPSFGRRYKVCIHHGLGCVVSVSTFKRQDATTLRLPELSLCPLTATTQRLLPTRYGGLRRANALEHSADCNPNANTHPVVQGQCERAGKEQVRVYPLREPLQMNGIEEYGSLASLTLRDIAHGLGSTVP